MSQGARWFALACVAVAAPVGSSLAQTAPPNTAFPPLSGPPIDVPMHVPQPPRDVDALPPPTQAAPPPRNQATPPQARAAPAPVRPTPEHPAPPQVVAAQERGTITPIAPQCRETTYRVIIDGRPETAIARICRMADGQWRLSP